MAALLGGVVGAVGSLVGGAASGVASVARYATGAGGQEPCADGKDAPTVFEQKADAKVDQVLFFFERELERHTAYVQNLDNLEKLRIDYYNCVNAIEFQNEVLSQLVDKMLEIRGYLRGNMEDDELWQALASVQGAIGEEFRKSMKAEKDARKEAGVRLAHIKLDVGERRSKRRAKEAERRALAEVLSPLIAEVKLQRFLEVQASEQQTTEVLPSRWDGRESADGGAVRCWRSPPDGAVSKSSDMEVHQSEATIARRRYKHYSDAELASLLREKDS